MNIDAGMAEALQQLLDREAIRTVLSTYARGCDRRVYELVRDAYHPEAFDDHGSYKGDREGLVAWLRRRHDDSVEQSMHMLGQCHVDFLDRDTAAAETYCRVTQRYTPEAQETRAMWGDSGEMGPDDRIVLDLACRYVDRLERREGCWALAERTVVVEDLQISRVRKLSLGAEWTRAKRDQSDALWKKVAEWKGN
jgi:hypothetical protein